MVPSVIVALESSGSTHSIVEELRKHGVRCLVADSLKNFRRYLTVQPIAAVVIDATYHGHSGMDLVREQPAMRANLPVVLHSDRTCNRLEAAIKGLKRGAMDVLLTPYEDEIFARIATICLDQNGPQRQNSIAKAVQPSEPLIPSEHQAHSRSILPVGSNQRGFQQTSDELLARKRWTPLQRQERKLIVEALDQTGGHVVDASRLLRMGQATVYRKIRQYKISRERAEQPQTA